MTEQCCHWTFSFLSYLFCNLICQGNRKFFSLLKLKTKKCWNLKSILCGEVVLLMEIDVLSKVQTPLKYIPMMPSRLILRFCSCFYQLERVNSGWNLSVFSRRGCIVSVRRDFQKGRIDQKGEIWPLWQLWLFEIFGSFFF